MTSSKELLIGMSTFADISHKSRRTTEQTEMSTRETVRQEKRSW